MNLHHLLEKRRAAGKPVRVALIGAGKFGSMFLSQVPHTPGLEVPVIVDLDPIAHARLAARWDGRRADRGHDIHERWIRRDRRKHRSDRRGDRQSIGRNSSCAGSNCRGQAYRHGQCRSRRAGGPLLADEARRAGVVYSLAYGDQPALTAEMVDWARATGFKVVAAGKGTKYLPIYHDVTPAGVWGHYGLTAAEAPVRRHESADVQFVS